MENLKNTDISLNMIDTLQKQIDDIIQLNLKKLDDL